MSDQRALLAAICAHPEEDTPRLAYADWLDEHAGSMPAKKRESVRRRAELIRVQCEMARLSPDEEDVDTATRRVELELREAELLKNDARRKAWAKPLKSPPAGHDEFVPNAHRFVRGFPRFADNAYTDRNGYLTVGEALFEVSPVHLIDCRNVHGEGADRFLALPWLPRVRRLSISTNLDRSRWEDGPGGRHWVSSTDGTDVAATEKLFAAPGLGGLEELELRNWRFGPAGGYAVRALGALRKLELSGGIVSGPDTFVRLGELLPVDLRPREFELVNARYGADELRTLADLSQFRSLERLTLGTRNGAIWYQPPAALGIAGVQALTGSAYWPHLRAFRDHMGAHGITATEVEEFAEAPPPPGLRTLSLSRGALGGGIGALARSPLLASVTALNLSNNTPGDDVASALAHSPHLGRLLSLKLDYCDVGPEGVKALAEAPFAANLVRLGLVGCRLNKVAVDALLAPGAFPRLRLLNVQRAVRYREHKDRLRARFGPGLVV